MTVIRNSGHDPQQTYLATFALFCGIMCTIVMLKCRGFKASLNLLSGKKRRKEQYDKTSDIPVLGAYRSNRDEYFGSDNPNNTAGKLTISMVKLPQTSRPKQVMKPSKSTSDLIKLNDIPQNSKTTNGESPSKNIKITEKEHRKLEKQKLSEQKHKESSHEQQNREKLKIINDRESRSKSAQVARPKGERKKAPAPKPPASQASQIPVYYSSDTLESSISRSSGPPPYTAEVVPCEYDSSGNTCYGKPIDGASSWNLISQHRQQLTRPAVEYNARHKNKLLDLGYNAGSTRQSIHVKDNSDT